MAEKMVNELKEFSKWLLPRKYYIKLKTNHPKLAGFIFILWNGFWTTLAFLFNFFFLLFVIIGIVLLIASIFSDDSFDMEFLMPNSYDFNYNKKKKKKKNK